MQLETDKESSVVSGGWGKRRRRDRRRDRRRRTPVSANPAGCPSSEPWTGEPCPSDGLQCSYGSADAFCTSLTGRLEWMVNMS